ncbi:MAG TPA: hypothetical protein ENO27_00710 [Caldithrix sp.]|nr:FecR domain-containing protein [Calditrichaceae bacterium]HEM48705.1 hypothetical protein [Caldithrix sp.]
MKIKPFILTILITLLIFSLSFAKDPIAVIVKTRGDVTIQYEKDGKREKIKRGTKLYSGAIIISREKSFAAMLFVDDRSMVRVRPNSILTVNGKREKATIAKNISLEVGTIFAQITKQKSGFQVTTPTSVASVKGTSFWTKQILKAGTYYYGIEGGPTEVSNDEGSALFKEGETCFVESKDHKPIVKKTKPGETPGFEDDSIDEFKIDFENEQGDIKTLKFKTRVKTNE